MIMSASMFSQLRYEIDDENHKLNVTIPDSQSWVRNLIIKDENGHLKVFCTSAECNIGFDKKNEESRDQWRNL